MKEYKSIWWDAEMPLHEELKDYPGWEIFKMFMIYPGAREAYRVILQRERSEEEEENKNKTLISDWLQTHIWDISTRLRNCFEVKELNAGTGTVKEFLEIMNK